MGIHLLFSQDCNLNCDYCFVQCIRDKKNISFENFIEVLEFLKNNNQPTLLLVGGEPTVHPEFNEFMKYTLKNYPTIKEIKVTTNGTFKKTCFENINLKRFDILFNITDRINNKKVLKNISIFKSEKVSYTFCITLNNNNFDTDSYINFIKEFQPKSVLINVALPQIDHKNKYLDTISPEFKKKFMRLLEEVIRLKISVRQDCFTPVCLFEENKKILHHMIQIAKCTNSYFISPDLLFYVCPFMNIPLARINRNTKMEELLCIQKSIAAKINHIKSEDCNSCLYKIRNNCLPCAAYDGNNLKILKENLKTENNSK